jgi:hypothetical protein
MASDSHEYRQRATHCFMLAAEARDVFAKRRLETLAHSWMKLASDLEMANVAAQIAAVRTWRGSASRANGGTGKTECADSPLWTVDKFQT